MTKLILPALLFSLLSVPAFSQRTPWADLPESTFVESAGGPKDVFLTLDTIKHYPGGSILPEDDPVQFWLADSNLKVGYGYLDKNGRPFGVWRYYVLKDKQYSLVSEGFYMKADTSDLQFSEDSRDQGTDVRSNYLAGVESKLMHTGEWRFYADGALTYRVFLQDKSTMEFFDHIVFNENGEEEKTSRMMEVQWRLIGDIDIVESYYPGGNIRSVTGSNGYRLSFTEDGKPVKHEPLDDMWGAFR